MPEAYRKVRISQSLEGRYLEVFPAYNEKTMTAPELTPLQVLLKRLRDDLCGGNSSELARRIKKDATYVSRLFYPADKAGAKVIGLEIMRACTRAFGLPPGYWDGVGATLPLSQEVQAAIAILDRDAAQKVDNVVRAHLGLSISPSQKTPEPVVIYNSDIDRQFTVAQNKLTGVPDLTVVRSTPTPSTPLLDAEDAKHRKQPAADHDRRSNKIPADQSRREDDRNTD